MDPNELHSFKSMMWELKSMDKMCVIAREQAFLLERFSVMHTIVHKVNIILKDKNVQMTKKWARLNEKPKHLTGTGNSKCKFIFKLNSAYLTSMLICNLWEHALFIVFPEMSEQSHTVFKTIWTDQYLHFLTIGSQNSCIWRRSAHYGNCLHYKTIIQSNS